MANTGTPPKTPEGASEGIGQNPNLTQEEKEQQGLWIDPNAEATGVNDVQQNPKFLFEQDSEDDNRDVPDIHRIYTQEPFMGGVIKQ